MVDARPIFQPRSIRPIEADRVEMKRAVMQRDGLDRGCYWCGKPFSNWNESTLEHIIPLADGGEHSLGNCALACVPCNLKNVPKSVVEFSEKSKIERLAKAAANRMANGGSGPRAKEIVLSPNPIDAPDYLVSRFEAIARPRNGRPVKAREAKGILRAIHGSLRLNPPTKLERDIFMRHFNYWLTNRAS